MAEHQNADRLATVGGRMRAVRLAKGMTAGAVAEKLDVSRPTISTWETNQVEKIDKNKLVDFSKLTDVSLKWLMAGVGKQPDLDLDIPERTLVGKRQTRAEEEPQSAVDPMVKALLSHLPTAGSVWPKADRKRWLALLEGSFDLIYKDNEPHG
jgi:transcriptional regulator with XRE-family HTH domain